MMRIGSCLWLNNVTRRLTASRRGHLGRRELAWSVPTQNHASHQVNEKRASARRRKDRQTYDYQSDEATFARHILRTILRECTYLPDRFAADYVKHHALARFRANAYKAWKDREQFESQYKSRRKEGRQVISTLQRASRGDRDRLLKVLNSAYGRIGKRRHELMRPLLGVKGTDEILKATPDSDAATSGDENALLDDADGSQAEKTLRQTFTRLSVTTPLDLTPQLRALLKSQIRVKPPNTVRSNPKRIEPVIEERNSWHRPMPQKRIRNARRKQYAFLLERVQAPLPIEEWERLRDLALGKVAPQQPVRRRRKSQVTVAEDGIADERQQEGGMTALEMVARYGRPVEKGRGYNITPRFMQRLYAEVFSQCPLMEWDSATEEWKVTWGFQMLLNVEQSSQEVHDGKGNPAQSLDAAVAAVTSMPDTPVIGVNA